MTAGPIRLLVIAVSATAFACASTAGTAARAPAPAAAPSVPGPAPAVAPPGPAESMGLSFATDPADAEIAINGRLYGKVADLPSGGFVPLQPGLYRVSLSHAGFSTWRAEVAVRSGVEPIHVTLPRKR